MIRLSNWPSRRPVKIPYVDQWTSTAMTSRVIIVTNVYSTNDRVRCRRATGLLVACGRVGRKVSTAAALWHSDARAAGTTTHGIPPQPPANNSDDCRQQNDKTIQISVCRSVHITHTPCNPTKCDLRNCLSFENKAIQLLVLDGMTDTPPKSRDTAQLGGRVHVNKVNIT